MELRAEVDGEIFGEQHARSEVVPVGKPAWNDQEIVVEQQVRSLQHLVDVQEIGGEAHETAGPGGLAVAVDAGGAQHEGAWAAHTSSPFQASCRSATVRSINTCAPPRTVKRPVGATTPMHAMSCTPWERMCASKASSCSGATTTRKREQ